MSAAPLIGITAGIGQSQPRYAKAIERSGGVPCLLRPDSANAPAKAIGKVHGLLLPGGEDIDPNMHVEARGTLKGSPRDMMEVSLLEVALAEDLPVLGICRGMQAINVATGGSLVQGLDAHDVLGEDRDESAYHRVYISPGSKLAAIVGSGGFVRVNSRHHQGVTEGVKSSRLLASAYSLDDGVIEGLESPDHEWVIGVQFHPERRMEIPPHFERLFQSFVERAARG